MAGFFGFFDYTKPGPGVPKDAPPKSRFIVFFEVFLRKFWRLVTLNIIYFIACIPIITIGPATAGFTYVLRNFSREEHAWVWSDFKEHALRNFKQAFIISVIDLFALVIGYVNFQFYSRIGTQNVLLGYLKYVIAAMGIIFIIMHLYIYPMLVTFKLTVKQIFKNAFIFAILKLPQNIGMLFLCAIVALGFYYYYMIGILLTPFIVLSTLGLMINFYVYPILQKYMIDKIQAVEEVENTEKVEDIEDIDANVQA